MNDDSESEDEDAWMTLLTNPEAEPKPLPIQLQVSKESRKKHSTVYAEIERLCALHADSKKEERDVTEVYNVHVSIPQRYQVINLHAVIHGPLMEALVRCGVTGMWVMPAGECADTRWRTSALKFYFEKLQSPTML